MAGHDARPPTSEPATTDVTLSRFAGLLAVCLFCGVAWGLVVYLLGVDERVFVLGTFALALVAFGEGFRRMEGWKR